MWRGQSEHLCTRRKEWNDNLWPSAPLNYHLHEGSVGEFVNAIKIVRRGMFSCDFSNDGKRGTAAQAKD
jgi:hypothetical protein